ncbi:AAEL002925-PA [Aedes aegypti]|uniref:AAEL002925-PA n=1 Tax=Aedes aegypti TaxID=7159 RepID=Q17GN1_AEDAE|nr:AAEL002925-PA [Aedes aegypti]
MEAEANPAKANLEPRCRLCLQWIELDDGLIRHGDIFASGNGLSLKIRDCVGVFVAPEDSIRTICYNCQQTVCLIDDFRMLCRQTEEIYESVRICCKEGIKWDRYKEHVDELRLLLQEHKDVINGHLVEYDSEPEAKDENSISNAFVPMMEVKEELEYDEEWEPDPIVGEFLEIKPECTDETEPEEKLNTDDDEDNNKSGHEYHKTIPIKLKLALAEEVLNNPVLWDTSQARSAKNVGNIWKEIATKFDVDKKTIRARWRTLKSFYQHNRVRKADRHNTNAKYRKFMETMRSIIGPAGEDDNLEETEKPQETSCALDQSSENTPIPKGRVKKAPPLSLHSLSKRMQLAQLVHKHQMLWNRKHTDFASAFAKEETWGTIAQQMKISREEAKYAWKNLRDLYRGRMKRVLKGQLDRDARILKDPLFKLLDVMCADNMRISTAPTVASKSLVTNEPDSNDTTEALEEESFPQTSNQDESDGESERELDCSIEIKEETISSSDQSSFDLQIAFAEEILVRLNESSQVDEASLCKEVGKHLQLSPATAKARWNVMKQNYIDNRARASSAGLQTRLRLQDCALFNLMNQIVPKLDHMEPYVAEEEKTTVDRRRLPVESKIAIAEEIRRNPEIWNTSMACSSGTLEKVWIKVGNKFQMDADTIRNHWRALQGLSRTHARKERKGCTPSKDKKLCKLLGILRSMKYQADGQNENPEETIVAKQESNSDEETDMPAAKDESQPKDNKPPKLSDLALGSDAKRMDLAQFVHKHEFLWNHKHPDFGNIILKDQTWDIVAASMNVTRDEIKYGWKCLRDLYRGRIKRVFNGNLPSNAPLLQDPLFKLLEVMCAKNMKIGAHSAIVKDPKSAVKNESESNDAGEEPEDAFSVKFDRNVKLQLISLVEQNDLIWNSENPEHLNLDKRDLIWDTIAEKMNFSKATVKALWTRLRNVYRGRKLRLMKGLMRQNSPLLREPVYAKLHKLLDGHMQLGKFTKTKKPALRKGTEPMELGAAVETGPFATMEEKVRLVEEVIKHELLWNSNHDE